MLLANVEDLGDRRDVAVHRIDAFERDQLGAARLDCGEQPVEILGVVMLEAQALRTAVANALNHRGMVERV